MIGVKFSDRLCGGELYFSLIFILILRRKLEFYIINMIFFMILMVFFILMVYKLLLEFGEKMGYCLMVLLVYVVYFFFIFDNIFSILKNICYLCEYY